MAGLVPTISILLAMHRRVNRDARHISVRSDAVLRTALTFALAGLRCCLDACGRGGDEILTRGIVGERARGNEHRMIAAAEQHDGAQVIDALHGAPAKPHHHRCALVA
jgi:hypothetical protein